MTQRPPVPQKVSLAYTADGYLAERHASINDVPITEDERTFRRDRSAPRPADHPGRTDLVL